MLLRQRLRRVTRSLETFAAVDEGSFLAEPAFREGGSVICVSLRQVDGSKVDLSGLMRSLPSCQVRVREDRRLKGSSRVDVYFQPLSPLAHALLVLSRVGFVSSFLMLLTSVVTCL